MINRLIVVLFMFSYQSGYSQMSIGKKYVEGSGLLDFQENTTKGIILPHIEDVDLMENVTQGTFVFDQKSTRVKFFDGSDWIDMNEIDGYNPPKLDAGNNISDQGVIIGSEKSDAKGVLVLESNDKSLILPKIENPAKNVKSPYAGMICYDTLSDNVYIFNGEYWTFWGMDNDIE